MPHSKLPIVGLQPLLGVDRFMSEARAITNLIGNGVATMVVAKWEGEFDWARYEAAMAGRPLALMNVPEVAGDVARQPDAADLKVGA
jgi:aerobic C4-dicarboxylate transport protein